MVQILIIAHLAVPYKAPSAELRGEGCPGLGVGLGGQLGIALVDGQGAGRRGSRGERSGAPLVGAFRALLHHAFRFAAHQTPPHSGGVAGRAARGETASAEKKRNIPILIPTLIQTINQPANVIKVSTVHK